MKRALKCFCAAFAFCLLALSSQLSLTTKVAAVRLSPNTATTVPLYRLLDTQSQQHFYTANQVEKDSVLKYQKYVVDGIIYPVFKYEGITGYVYMERVSGTIPLYRLVLNGSSKHFYTTKADERDQAIAKYNYKSEGIACYVSEKQQPGTAPLFRLYRPASSGVVEDHFYTASEDERYKAQFTFGYQPERNEGYIWTGSANGPSQPPKINVPPGVIRTPRPN